MKRLLPSLQKYISLNLSFLVILILLRFFEYFYASNLHSLPQGSFYLSIHGLAFDVYLSFIISAFLLIPFEILSLLHRNAGIIFFKITASIIVIILISLIHYFSVQLIPLGKDLFGYSWSEISQTVNASGELNVTSLIPFVIFIILFIYLPKLIRIVIFRNYTMYIYYAVNIFSVLFLNIFLVANTKNYKTDLDYYLVNNKLSYFIYDNYYKGNNAPDSQPSNQNSELQSQNNKLPTPKYLSDEYPLLRIDDTKDVLGQFFNKGDKKPNIVIIITESLSAAFTGKDAYMGSFTQFLDSLIGHSLYWKNFLSTAGRTFGATPAILGSLPFGRNGFMEMGENSPNHSGLMSILKKNDYYCSFYYGGDPDFDKMEQFYKRENADFILHPKDFTSPNSQLPTHNYVKFPPKSNGFSWGYADREVFRRSLEITNAAKKEPRLDVYMTLAMHDPFLVPDEAYYQKKVDARVHQLGLDKGAYAETYIKDKEKFASIMYTDDAFRYLINEYKKRDDFKNTIFIITGDHRMVEIPIISKIDKFHVPLIIYSPMLKNKEIFESVSSHLDITPTLLAFLKYNYGIKTPETCHWLGHEIDVNKSFRNTHTLGFMWDKNDLIDFIDKGYFIDQNQLFKLGRNMNIDPIQNDTIYKRIQNEFDKFKKMNAYVCGKNKLYPK